MTTAIRLDDTVDTCDCCGRAGLKHTVLMRLEDDSIVNYGTTCAARNTGKDQRQIKKEISQSLTENIGRASDELSSSAEARALRAYRLTGAISEIGWDAYLKSPQVLAVESLKQRLATQYGVPAGSL